MKNKIETSKKIVLATGLIFALVIIVCLGIFVFCTIACVDYDWTGIVSLLTVSGSAFTTTIAAYESKAKAENVYKIKLSFLQEKYNILKNIGALDISRAQLEIENEINQIDCHLDTAEEENSVGSTYQQIM